LAGSPLRQAFKREVKGPPERRTLRETVPEGQAKVGEARLIDLPHKGSQSLQEDTPCAQRSKKPTKQALIPEDAVAALRDGFTYLWYDKRQY
jgi:hypothetical protein